jgi:hypothetical protein
MTKQREIYFIPTLIYFTCNYQNEYKKFVRIIKNYLILLLIQSSELILNSLD